jgi:hypothetical protein
MRYVIRTAAKRTAIGNIDNVKYQRRVHWNRGMQAARRLPGPISHAANKLSAGSRRLQWQSPAVAQHRMTLSSKAANANLQSFDGRIDISRRAARSRLLTQHIPGLNGLPQFNLHAVIADRAVNRKTEFKKGIEPRGIEAITIAGSSRR